MAEIAKQCRDHRRINALMDMTPEEFSKIKHELEGTLNTPISIST